MGSGDPEMARRGSDPIPEEPQSTANSRCCFCFPCFPSSSSSVGLWDRIRSSSYASPHDQQHKNRWWAPGIRALMKIREWSEIVAGPKWKTFIRRFNRNSNRGGGGGGCFSSFINNSSSNNRRHHGEGGGKQFQYDPLSYALNFDEGQNHGGGGYDGGDYYDFDDGHGHFSSRYAAVPGSVTTKAAAVTA